MFYGLLRFLFQIIDSQFITLFGAILLVIVFGIIIILIGFFQENKDHQSAIQQRMNYSMIYRIMLDIEKVEEFDVRKSTVQKNYILDDFLKFYAPSDREKLFLWLTQLTKQSRDVAWTFQTHLFQDRRQQQQVIFEVNHISNQTNVIHLRRYILRYLKPNIKTRRSVRYALTTEEAVKLTKKMAKQDGAFFYVSFNFGRATLDEQFKAFYLSQFKEKLIIFVPNTSNH